jgi:hypothetical protein
LVGAAASNRSTLTFKVYSLPDSERCPLVGVKIETACRLARPKKVTGSNKPSHKRLP